MLNTAKHDTVDVPASKMKIAIAEILLNEGYITKYEVLDEENFKTIRITLKYGKDKNEELLQELRKFLSQVFVFMPEKMNYQEFLVDLEQQSYQQTKV